jgi:hypothetical protein
MLPEGGLPDFSGPRYDEIATNNLPQFAEKSEEAYMKRLKLRMQIRNDPISSKYVPTPSTLEVEIGLQLKRLNEMTDNPDKVLELEWLYQRWNTRSVFAIAQSLAHMRLQKKSILEMEAVVNGDSVSKAIKNITKSTSDRVEDIRLKVELRTV